MFSIALLGEFRRACLMLALEGATAAFALDCHGKKKNATSLQPSASLQHQELHPV
jgi:hypothetical protein